MKSSSSTSVRTSAKDVFLHLLGTVTLFVSVIYLIALLFQYVNVSFPDALDPYSFSLNTVRQAMAAILITWPVYIAMDWLIYRDIKKEPAKQHLGVRKWLLYFTLFVASITIIIDLITLVYQFLGGELTTRFGLKVLAVLLIAAGVFGYYIWDLHRDAKKPSRIPLIAATVSSVLLLVTIVSGFFLLGSPTTQRALRLDAERVQDLQSIQMSVINYWEQKDVLPESLNQAGEIVPWEIQKDPVTEESYTYNITGDLSFELCATFAKESPKWDVGGNLRYQFYPEAETGESWNHRAGEECFEHTIDPDLYNQDDGRFPKPIPAY